MLLLLFFNTALAGSGFKSLEWKEDLFSYNCKFSLKCLWKRSDFLFSFSPSLVYLNLSVISFAVWFPDTLFPVGLCYYTCLTCFDAFSFLSFVSFSSWISHNASLSFSPHKSLFTFYSLDSRWSTLPERPFAPSVSPWTRRSLWSFFTVLSFCTFPSQRSLRPRKTGHAVWSWYAGKTMTQYRFLKI